MNEKIPIYKMHEMGYKEIIPGTKLKFLNSAHMTFAHWNFQPKVLLPEHSHLHEQVTTIVKGQFDITIYKETKKLNSGDVIIIPPHAPHSGFSQSDCYIIDVFYPIREDYR